MRMGLPKLLTTDQGSEFRNHLDKEVMSLLGIKRHFVTPYHPQVPYLPSSSHYFNIPNHQANGLDERWKQTMKNMLIKFTGTQKETWDEHLDFCVFAYNTSRQESTQCSPFEVMFGRLARLPIEIDTDNEEASELLDAYLKPEVNLALASITLIPPCIFV